MRALRLTFRGKLLTSYFALIAALELGAALVLDRSLTADLVQQADARLEQQAWAVASWVSTAGGEERNALRLAGLTGARVTLFDRTGKVIGDSEWLRHEVAGPSTVGGDDPGAPEISEASRGRVGRATRVSASGAEMRYLAVPARDGMAVRLGRPVSELAQAVSAARQRLLVAVAFGLLVAVALAWIAAHRIARPIRAMTQAATQIAQGKYQVSLPEGSGDELGELSSALTSMAAQLQARFNELKRLEEERRQFLADTAHEVRTPVTAIQGFAQTLLEQADPSSAREYAEIIHRHAQRIGRLVADLLCLSRLETRTLGGRRTELVAVEGIQASVVGSFRVPAEAKGMRIEVSCEPNLCVWADPEEVERVLENLVDNALKYGRANGRVELTGRRTDNRVELRVGDDGPGIAPGHLPRLFERFYRVDQSRSRELGGSGLGLAIVKELVESMGGTVKVESEPGVGTTFVIDLPPADPRVQSDQLEHRKLRSA